LVSDTSQLSFSELSEKVNCFANALSKRGVGPGDRICVVDVNTPAHVISFFAASRLDAIYVPLNFRGQGEELTFPLRHADPKVIVAGSRYVPLIDEYKDEFQAVVRIIGSSEQNHYQGWLDLDSIIESADVDELIFPEGSPEDTAVLLFTAGTTGYPKAVMLKHSSFTSFLLTSLEPPNPEIIEKTLLTLPLYHVAGLQAVLAGIYGGRTIIMQRQFEPGEWMRLVEEHEVQRALIVPTMLKQVIDHPEFKTRDLSSLQILTYGGSSMPPTLIKRAVPLMPNVQFINAFGQTETGSTITMVPPEDHVLDGSEELVALRIKHLSSIGKPLPDVEVRVVNDEGEFVGYGVSGEIIAKSPRLMTGYWKQPQETSQVFHEEWLYTGDLGYQEEDGYIYLEGRAKDFIKRGGEMVSPEEVEHFLHEIPEIEECAVIGLPDETWGERVVAVVVASSENPNLTEESILESCQILARFKRPEQIIFRKELPRNSLGKVLKKNLRQELALDS
tara:strand:- start:10513 stop:12021 length:1509 start_codon:yes stop_codon:yes gene_type:complete